MPDILDRLLARVDRLTETGARRSARQHGRRSFLAKAGAFLVGGALVPMLPFDRTLAAAGADAAGDPMDAASCSYWRYCALDGNLCDASGGSTTTCPPGSEASSVAWIGTCNNPADNRAYLVSYNDCCGKAQMSGATFCFTSEGERPGYRMSLYNDINWCMANANKGYHCTLAVLVGVADG